MSIELHQKPVVVGPTVAVASYAAGKGWGPGDFIPVSHPKNLRLIDPAAIAAVILVNAKTLGAALYQDIDLELRELRRLWKHITVKRESVRLPFKPDEAA